MKIYVFVYYTKEVKPPVIFHENEMEAMLEEIVRMTKLSGKFAVYLLGKCVGDFS